MKRTATFTSRPPRPVPGLKPGSTADYSNDPVAIRGILKVDDRWDGDWQLGLYWMEGAEVVK